MSVINDFTEGIRHSINEINDHICVFNGYDRPRYYLPNTKVAGYLGLEDWSTYKDKPVYASEGTGELDESKYYSIYVVPMDSNIVAAGFPIYGNATLPAIPVSPSVASASLNFTIPVHPQYRITQTGTCDTTATGTTMTDTTVPFEADAYDEGYWVKNIETGVLSNIVSGTTSALTTTDSMVWAEGDRYQILESEATARVIYAAEMSSASGVNTSTYYLAGVVSDNSTTTFELASYATGETFAGDMYAPPNAATCHSAGELLYCAGGITEEGVGTSAWLGTGESKQASVSSETVVSIVDDDFTSALTSQIVRYTPATVFTNIYIGSYVTITDSTDIGNDGEDMRVLRVAEDNSWFEVLNNDGVEDAVDATMLIAMTPNVIQGTGTNFSEGMIDAYFEFTNDNVGSSKIAWVDVVTQEIGLSSFYTGNNGGVTTEEYKIQSDYSLYFSDYKNPHRFRSVNLIEIGDTIKALYALGQYLMVFCSGSLWRFNPLEPGASPVLISDNIFFDAPFSVCSNGSYICFYDGEGISLTEGATVTSLTGLKAKSYMNNVNKELANQIQGIYNPVDMRFEFYLPMGTDTHNNYGLYITESGYNCMPFSRSDANVVFSGYENGRFTMYHGTSGDFSSGAGTIWSHSGVTDGLTGSAFESLISDITDQVVTVLGNSNLSWATGDVITFYPTSTGNYRQAIVESVVDNGDNEYALSFASEIDLTLFSVGDSVLYGMIPFDYGIKWTDFSSPQFLHRVKRLFIDQSGMTGSLWIDHYLDLGDTPVQTTYRAVTPEDTKINIPFRMGTGYTYGFRLRGYSSTEFKINSFERVFRTQA